MNHHLVHGGIPTCGKNYFQSKLIMIYKRATSEENLPIIKFPNKHILVPLYYLWQRHNTFLYLLFLHILLIDDVPITHLYNRRSPCLTQDSSINSMIKIMIHQNTKISNSKVNYINWMRMNTSVATTIRFHVLYDKMHLNFRTIYKEVAKVKIKNII